MNTLRKSFASSMQRAATDRQFNVVISTASVDRDGDTIDPRGWQLDAFRANPIILFNHDRSKPPIARATSVQAQGNQLTATMEFPPSGISPLADEVAGLMHAGFLHSTSVGFLPLEWTPNGHGGKHFSKTELTEFSVVNVPSQTEAIIQRCAGKPCDAQAVKAWLGRVKDQAPAIGQAVSRTVAASFTQRDAPRTPWSGREDEEIPPPSPGIAAEEDSAVLILADARVLSAARRVAKEAGRLAQEALQKSWDAPVLEIEETYEVDEHVVRAGVAAAVGVLVAHEAALAVTKAINYARGRVD